ERKSRDPSRLRNRTKPSFSYLIQVLYENKTSVLVIARVYVRTVGTMCSNSNVFAKRPNATISTQLRLCLRLYRFLLLSCRARCTHMCSCTPPTPTTCMCSEN
ncbi:unnamed protein product, partial [Sphacelaria rigidula]